jgi:hypothetical protein
MSSVELWSAGVWKVELRNDGLSASPPVTSAARDFPVISEVRSSWSRTLSVGSSYTDDVSEYPSVSDGGSESIDRASSSESTELELSYSVSLSDSRDDDSVSTFASPTQLCGPSPEIELGGDELCDDSVSEAGLCPAGPCPAGLCADEL